MIDSKAIKRCECLSFDIVPYRRPPYNYCKGCRSEVRYQKTENIGWHVMHGNLTAEIFSPIKEPSTRVEL